MVEYPNFQRRTSSSKESLLSKLSKVLSVHHEIGTNVANPIDEDNIIGDAEQTQPANMQASAVQCNVRQYTVLAYN